DLIRDLLSDALDAHLFRLDGRHFKKCSAGLLSYPQGHSIRLSALLGRLDMSPATSLATVYPPRPCCRSRLWLVNFRRNLRAVFRLVQGSRHLFPGWHGNEPAPIRYRHYRSSRLRTCSCVLLALAFIARGVLLALVRIRTP